MTDGAFERNGILAVHTDADPSGPSARLDLGRDARVGLPEAVYGKSKTVEQCERIVTDLLAHGDDTVIATRLGPDHRGALAALDPAGAEYETMTWRPRPATGRTVAVVAAGTSDLPVAAECRLSLAALGHQVDQITDVGVAGLQRLLDVLPDLATTDVIVAIAGMEGALPTVLAGLVHQPIVAVPTSVGYGAALEGQTALASMLTSCAPGIAVVNIDNGFGAACVTHRILAALGRAAANGPLAGP